MYVCGYACALMYAWRSEVSFVESGLSFHLYMGPGLTAGSRDTRLVQIVSID